MLYILAVEKKIQDYIHTCQKSIPGFATQICYLPKAMFCKVKVNDP